MDAKRLSAFTLVELLVVISIIALLIAILLPSLQAARVSAKATKGTAQVKQIQLALVMYSDINKGFLPYASIGGILGTKSDSGPYWSDLLLSSELIQSKEFFHSPDHNRDIVASNVNNLKFSGFGVFQDGVMPTYWGSSSTAGIVKGFLPYAYGRVGRPNPSELLVVGDTFAGSNITQYDGWFTISGLFTYNKRFIRSYADGHAESNEAINVRYHVLGQRAGFFDYNGNGIKEDDQYDAINRHWTAPWYPRFYGLNYPVAGATY